MKQEIMWIGNVCTTKTRSNPNQGRVYDTNGISPTLNQMEGGNRQPMILIKRSDCIGFDWWNAKTSSNKD